MKKNIKQVLAQIRGHDKELVAELRTLENPNPKLKAGQGFVYLQARRLGELDRLRKMPLEQAFDTYSSGSVLLENASDEIKTYFQDQKISGVFDDYIKVQGDIDDAGLMVAFAHAIVRNPYRYTQGINDVPANLGDLSCNWCGNGPVLHLTRELGVSAFEHLKQGIPVIQRCGIKHDCETAEILAGYVDTPFRAELTEYEDMFKPPEEPISAVFCAHNVGMLYGINEGLAVVPKVREFFQGRIICFVQQKELLASRNARLVEIKKELVDSGQLKVVLSLPAKPGVRFEEQWCMLFIDSVGSKPDGVMMADAASFTYQSMGHSFLNSNSLGYLLSRNRKELLDEACICSQAELAEDGYCLSPQRFLIEEINRIFLAQARMTGLKLSDIAEIERCKDVEMVFGGDAIPCFEAKETDIDEYHFLNKPVKHIPVEPGKIQKSLLNNEDLVFVVKGPQKGNFGLILDKREKDGIWLAGSRFVRIRVKRQAAMVWPPERLYRYFGSAPIRAYVRSRLVNPMVKYFPIADLLNMPMLMID